MALSLSRDGIDKFNTENIYGMEMFMGAVSDYIAARCCLLNGLFSGLYLGALSVEKVFKAILYIETNSKLKIHDLIGLKSELTKHKDYGLDRFDGYLKKLYSDYQARYHDNPDRSMSMNTKELDELDELWLYLVEMLPAPDEVKYNTAFFAFLFAAPGFGYDFWLSKNNKALNMRFRGFAARYLEVFDHLYPNIEPPSDISNLRSLV